MNARIEKLVENLEEPLIVTGEANIRYLTGFVSSNVSLEHADPECTATPRWSSASRIGSASTPSTPRHTRLGSRSSGSP